MNSSEFVPTIERFTGFGAHYNEARPSSPDALADLLCPMAQCVRPTLVVDLGCGTGLSTRYWSNRAEAIVGVDPTASMREQAESLGGASIQYREGYSHATGLPDGCADMVTCAQSLHWMEPSGTFAEARRILRDGGVFAAYDYDWPPSTGSWEMDRTYEAVVKEAHRLEREHGITDQLKRWDKDGHLRRMEESGCFRYTRECVLHHRDEGSAARIVGVYLSQGHVQSLLKLGVTEEDLGISRLREVAMEEFGEAKSEWFWSARVRVGVR